ncbi:MAG: DNA modification methylase [Anaerolineae bacterium]|nr:DNA modification methylase [Anaerolineae bacterium]
MKHYHKNPRKITKSQAQALKRDLRVYGDLSGIIHNVRTDELIGGNQRSEAIEGIISGILHPVIVKEYDEPTEAGTLAVGFYDWHGEQYSYRRVDWDDKTAELANLIANKAGGFWDWDILANDFDVEILFDAGFTEDELLGNDFDLGLEESADAEPQIDRAEELQEKWQVKTGDLWQIGEHRLICGDCTDAAVVERLMGGEKADMVFTDPPYGIEYDNQKRWEGLKKQSESAARNRGAMIEGDDKEFDPSFILKYFKGCKEIFLWGMQYYLSSLGNGGVIVWNRKMEQQKDTPFADFELCWSKQQRHKMAWITWGGWKSKEKGEERLHTTQKPIELAEWFFERWSNLGDIIVDLYIGSGFTLVACENLNRKGRGVEISPKYCAVTLERMSEAFPLLEIKRISE